MTHHLFETSFEAAMRKLKMEESKIRTKKKLRFYPCSNLRKKTTMDFQLMSDDEPGVYYLTPLGRYVKRAEVYCLLHYKETGELRCCYHYEKHQRGANLKGEEICIKYEHPIIDFKRQIKEALTGSITASELSQVNLNLQKALDEDLGSEHLIHLRTLIISMATDQYTAEGYSELVVDLARHGWDYQEIIGLLLYIRQREAME